MSNNERLNKQTFVLHIVGCILYKPSYMAYVNLFLTIEARIVLVVFNLLLKLWRISPARGNEGTFLGMRTVLYLGLDGATWMYIYIKAHQAICAFNLCTSLYVTCNGKIKDKRGLEINVTN